MDKNFLDTLSKDGDAYLIRSAEDLCSLSEYVNAGNDCKEKIFKLANDIDLSDVENFTPIGTQEINHFAGTFDGDGKTISNLRIVGKKTSVSSATCTWAARFKTSNLLTSKSAAFSMSAGLSASMTTRLKIVRQAVTSAARNMSADSSDKITTAQLIIGSTGGNVSKRDEII